MPYRRRKRRNPDPLTPIDQPCWLVVVNQSGEILESSELPPQTDLKVVMTRVHAERIAAGWLCETDGRFGFFFCNRGPARLKVAIHRLKPGTDPPSHKTPDRWQR